MDGIDELIKTGEDTLKAIEERFVQERLEAEVYEANRRTEFLSKLGELLPEAIRPYLEFECLHTPNYDNRQMWNAQAMIRIPKMARIRILCQIYEPKGEMFVQFYDRHGNQPFHVLDWQPRLDNYDNVFYTGYQEVWEGDDLIIALVKAKRTGDNFEAIQEEVDQRNREKAAEPAAELVQMEIKADQIPLIVALKEFIADEVKLINTLNQGCYRE